MHLNFTMFFVSHYASLALLILMSYLIGNRVIGRISYSSGVEKFCFCTALGLGIVATVVLGLGLIRLVTREAIFTLFVLSAFLVGPAWIELGRDSSRLLRSMNSQRAFMYGIAALLLLPLLLLPLYPPTQWDATSYHLAAAKIYAKNHAVVFTPYLRFPVFPQLNEMLFTLMLIVHDDISAQLVEFFTVVLIGIALYAWGRRAFGSGVGLFAAVLWMSNPIVLWLGASAYIDAGLVLFTTLAVYAFFNWFRDRVVTWLVIAAALIGFAAASKYLALFPLAVCSIFLLGYSIKKRKVKELVMFAVIVTVVAGPWYLRDAYYTGNPVWPYFGNKLGYGNWTSEDVKLQLQEQTSFGAGKRPIALLLLGWNLVFHAPLFHADSGSLSVAYLLLLPLAFLVAVKNTYLRALLLAIVLYTLFWFSTVQVLRYLAPVIPFMSMAGAAALGNMLSRLPSLGRPLIARALSVVVCVLLLGIGWARGVALIPSSVPPVTAVERSSYLSRLLPLYPAYEFLNRTQGDKYSAYALDNSNMAYFADGTFIGDWFGPARYTSVLSCLSRPSNLYDRLSTLGANYLVMSEAGGLLDRSTLDFFLTPAFLEGHFQVVYADSYALIFSVHDRMVRLDESPELLTNTGFEKLSAEKPSDWALFGRPSVDITGANSHSGRTAVRADQNDWVSQIVPVESNHIYLLRNFSRSTQSAQFGRLQINWLDGNRHLLKADIQVVPEISEWRDHAMASTAPAKAAWAEIYASVHENSEVWFDDFSFVELRYR